MREKLVRYILNHGEQSFLHMDELAGLGRLSRRRLSDVLRDSKGCVSVDFVAHALNASREQARLYLSSWAKNGWLRRVRRGALFSGRLSSRSPG